MSLATRIVAGEFKHIIVLTGAGVSTNAGIPDYRSKSGLFAELMKQFPQANAPEDMFTRSFVSKYGLYDHPIYKHHIEEIKQSIPTPTHNMCNILHQRGLLVRVYTQNIDGLHQKAGLPDNMVIEYHGSLTKKMWYYMETQYLNRL